MFTYKLSHESGLNFTVGYINASDAVTDVSYSDVGITYTGMDGLTIGAAMSNNTIGNNIDSDESTMYATYATGGFTVGVQSSDLDHTTANSDQESIAYGVTYAVNDDLSIGYSYHELDFESTSLADQESTGVSASYTMGGMTLAGAMNSVDAMDGVATGDYEGYEFNLKFAF